jgi:D-sedoheptulose 7-phosphate isomerase
MSKRIDIINQRMEETIKVKREFSKELKEKILKVVDAIVKTHKNKKQVFVVGNGGSAADAQHLAAELVGRFLKEREPMNVIALSTNSSILTALVNDYPPETVFERQVRAHIKKGDVLIGITTSGNSPNIIKAIEEGKKRGALTIGMTGTSGGKMTKICDIILNVPSTSTPRIQESHIFIIHLICELVEEGI